MARSSRKRRRNRRTGSERADSARRHAADDGPPPAPWGSFPLSELVVLIALVLLVAGFVSGSARGPAMIGAGLVLGSLAGLELAVREHFAGYRSHTVLLAGSGGVAVLALLLVFGPRSLSPLLPVVAGLIAFGLAAWRFAASFRRRSGGALFKVRP